MAELDLLQHARSIFSAALRDCSVDAAFTRKTQVVSEAGKSLLKIAGATLDLTNVHHLRVVSAGKAAGEMLKSFLSHVPFATNREMQGVLIARDRPEGLPDNVQFFAGGHPIPNQASFDGARAALRVIGEASTMKDALCVFLISGGASAMMELPLAPEVTLDETAALYRLLVHSAAPIGEINCVRKHFSAVKGGRLALAAGSTPTITLLVSDVPPGQLDSLASGPTMADPSTISECRELLHAYSLNSQLPDTIREFFASPSLPETPKPREVAPRFGVLLDSNDLVVAAERYAQTLGYHVVVDHTCDDWPHDEAARYLLDRIRVLRNEHSRPCLLSAGEVTVLVPGNLPPGVMHIGGRNQHLALHFATLLTSHDAPLAFLSAGSDGIDGNSSAAGGVVGATTLQSGSQLADAHHALDAFDSSTFLAGCGRTVVTGPSGNNLRDLRIVLAEPGV